MTAGEVYMLCLRCGGVRSGTPSPTMRSCVCSEEGAPQMFTVNATPAYYQGREVSTLTEADVRRIVREEVERTMRDMARSPLRGS